MNPLRQLHEQAEAEFQQYGEIEIVCTFGEPQAEYAAIRKGCALMDLPQRGILEATGGDRIDFLNRFLTNELIVKDSKAPLAAGSGVYAFLLYNKGRIVADVNVLQRGDRTLLETDARNIPTLRDVLEKHLFSENVKFQSLLEKSHQIALHGPKAAEILAQDRPRLARVGSARLAGGENRRYPDRDLAGRSLRSPGVLPHRSGGGRRKALDGNPRLIFGSRTGQAGRQAGRLGRVQHHPDRGGTPDVRH